MTSPVAFISYSHDSQEHKKWVLDFATRLRNSGIDAVLDQWELQPGDDIPHFMETHLARAERVLMICTERYVQKANSGSGGVGYEKMIVTSELLKRIDSNKVIPIIRQQGTHQVPTFLKSKLFIDFSRDEEAEFGFDELLRALHGAPLFAKPPIGNSPFTPIGDLPEERTGDPVRKLMEVVVADFEASHLRYTKYEDVRLVVGMSRIMLDAVIAQAKENGLITQDSDGDVRLTDVGKQYALRHKLV